MWGLCLPITFFFYIEIIYGEEPVLDTRLVTQLKPFLLPDLVTRLRPVRKPLLVTRLRPVSFYPFLPLKRTSSYRDNSPGTIKESRKNLRGKK
jgi:hypothetical protein